MIEYSNNNNDDRLIIIIYYYFLPKYEIECDNIIKWFFFNNQI
jgi:hypothetical protein